MAGEINDYQNRTLHGGINTRRNARIIDDNEATELINADITIPGLRTKKPSPVLLASLNAPAVDFDGVPLTGDATLDVQFTDLSTSDPVSWLWDFGDAGTSTGQNPLHSYTAAGTYTVSLTATNQYGSGNETKIAYVVVTASASALAGGDSLLTYATRDASVAGSADFILPGSLTDITLEFLVEYTGTDFSYDIYFESGAGSLIHLRLQKGLGASPNPDNIEADFFDGVNRDRAYYDAYPFGAGGKHYIAMTLSGTVGVSAYGCALYVDGVLQRTSATGSPNSSGSPRQVVSLNFLNANDPYAWFLLEDGGGTGRVKLSKVRLSNTAHTVFSDTYGIEADTVGFWSLDEGTGTDAADTSGNGNNFTADPPTDIHWLPWTPDITTQTVT